jgi:hypothetical protein
MPAEFILSSREIARSILATAEACRAVVAALADGRLPSPVLGRNKRCDLRAAPGFARGANLDAPGRVLYSSRDVAVLLAQEMNAPNMLISGGRHAPRRAGQLVLVAMALLEFFEECPEEKQAMLDNITSCRQGFQTHSLLKTLRKRRSRRAHVILSQSKQ